MRNPLHPDALRLEDLHDPERLGKSIAICNMVDRRAEYVELMAAPIQSDGVFFIRVRQVIGGKEEIAWRNLSTIGVVPDNSNKWSDRYVLIDPDACRDGILDDLVRVNSRREWILPEPTSRWDLALDMRPI